MKSLWPLFRGRSRRRDPKRGPDARPTFRPMLEQLEDRQAPAVTAGLSSGLLTVTLGAASDGATITGTAVGGSNINVVGTGLASTNFTGVTSISVQDGGSNASQSVSLSSVGFNTIIMTGDISVTGIETVTFSTSTT